MRRANDHILEGWPSEATFSDDYRTLDKCIDTMKQYARTYPSETWSVVQGASAPMVEIPFCLPIGEYLDCECGGKPRGDNEGHHGFCSLCGDNCEPIEYGGLIDLVIDFNGFLYVMDHKSTSQLGPTFFNQFRPNAQMTGYTWGVQQLSGREDIAGVYINAIGVFSKGPTRFDRQPTQRTPEEIAEWRKGVITKCNEIKRAERTGEWPMRTMNCVGKYGACEFYDVHSMPFEADRRRVLETDYEVKPWVFWEEHR